MLVVLSDLHFQDTASYARYQGPRREDRRNVSSKAFELFFRNLGGIAWRLRESDPSWGGEIRIVLAGDILEMNRSLRWFDVKPRARPYADAPVESGTVLDRRAALIYEKIKASDANGDTFALLSSMLDWSHAPGWETCFPENTTIRYDFVPGNHDRLVNLCPALNEAFRADLGLTHRTGFKAFPHLLRYPEYGVFVRHGKEYDEHNCEYVIGSDAPRHGSMRTLYDATPFGDFMTTEFAAQLVHRYYALATEGKFDGIAPDTPDYDRAIGILQAFDDVRPQGAVFDWLKQASPGLEGRSLWPSIRRTLLDTLRRLGRCPEFRDWLDGRDRKWVPDRIDLIQAALKAPETFLLWLAERVLPGEKSEEKIDHARIALDPEWENPSFRYAAVGHWHRAQNVALRTRFGQVDRALCSGTWRSRYMRCTEDHTFSASQTMNYLLFFRAEELASVDAGPGGRAVVSSADTVNMQRFREYGIVSAGKKARYLVRFTSIEVLDDSDPWGSGELFFRGVANGQSTGLRGQFDWREGTYAIDWEVEVVLKPGRDLTVGFTGHDDDTWPDPDDSLGEIQRTYTPEDREGWPAVTPTPAVLHREKGVLSSNGKMKVSWEILGRTWA